MQVPSEVIQNVPTDSAEEAQLGAIRYDRVRLVENPGSPTSKDEQEKDRL